MNQSNCYLLEKLANQSILNDAFIIKRFIIIFMKASLEKLLRKKRHMDGEKVLIRNILQKYLV